MMDVISAVAGKLWGIPMIIILVGGGVILTVRLGFVQFRHLPYIMKQTCGKMFEKGDTEEGAVSPFQAVSAALACTVGASNIVGVPMAIALGGPGAIVWMWVAALLGCATKYSEIVLGIKYRVKNANGEYAGGPMYYLKNGLSNKKLGAALAYIFAIAFALEVIPSVATQASSVVQITNTVNIPPMAVGIVLAVIVGIVIFGGIRRIVAVTEKLVPIMAVIYVGGCLAILVMHASAIPGAFAEIFSYALKPAAAVGGFAGAGVAQAARWGLARGSFSNEAGGGTAPIAHSTAQTDHPCRQAMWGVFEVLIDTIVICTMTALITMISGMWTEGSANSGGIVSAVFQQTFGPVGGFIVTLSVFLFVLSSMIVIIFYGEKQVEFLLGEKAVNVMKVVYVLMIIVGVLGAIEKWYGFLDLFTAFMNYTNMIGVVLMSGQVKELKKEFFESEEYYKKDIKKSRA